MYSTEQRKLAIETYIKFDLSAADTVAELGYPTRQSLKAWYKDYLEHGEIRPPKRQRDPKFTLEMRQAAVDYYLAHGKSLARTMRKMGYPASREYLCDWIDGLAPGQRKYRGPDPRREPVSVEKKVQVIAELEARTGPATEVAEKHGVSRTTPYVWRREIMGDNVGDIEEKGVPVSKEYDDLPDDIEVLQDMLREAKMQLRRVQLELDVRQATLEIVKKDQGADPELLTNEEKAAMVTALRAEYKLCEILPVVGMAKSSYEYARNAQAEGETEERAAARKAVIEAFKASGGTYGYRRITAMVDVGEWTVRDIMRDEGAGRPLRQEEAALQLLRGRDNRGAREPAARRAGQAPLPCRRAQRAVDHRRDRVPHPRRQGVPLAHRGLLRRHAAGLVDLHVARRRDGQLVAARRVQVARRGRPSQDPLGPRLPLPLAGMDKDMR